MKGIDKFLSRLNSEHPKEPIEAEQPRRGPGRPRVPKELRHPRSKDLSKCGPDGRLLKQYVKVKKRAGRFSPASKRRTKRRASKRQYAKQASYQQAYRDSLKRKFYQHRSVATIYARKHGLDPSVYYQLDYAQFVLIWETAPPVYDPEKPEHGLRPAKEMIDSPLKCRYDCTYLDRLDRTKPYTRENVRVFWRKRPLA